MARKLFENQEEIKRKPQDKDMRIEIAQDFERLKRESKAYYFMMKRISDMRDEAHLQIMVVDCESKTWKARLNALDEVMTIPEDFMRKATEALAEKELRSVV